MRDPSRTALKLRTDRIIFAKFVCNSPASKMLHGAQVRKIRPHGELRAAVTLLQNHGSDAVESELKRSADADGPSADDDDGMFFHIDVLHETNLQPFFDKTVLECSFSSSNSSVAARNDRPVIELQNGRFPVRRADVRRLRIMCFATDQPQSKKTDIGTVSDGLAIKDC